MPTVEPPVRCPRRVLIVQLAGMGDFVLLSPFLRNLRHAWPSARIELTVSPSIAAYAVQCPYVDAVWPAPVWPTGLLQRPRAYGRFTRTLRPRGPYDLAFAFDPFLTMIYPIRYLLDGARRPPTVGFDQNSRDPLNQAWSLPYQTGTAERRITDFVARPAGQPMVEYGRAALRHLGLDDGGGEPANPLEGWAAPEDHAWAAEQFPAADGPYAAVMPGASHPNRMWPAERFAAVMRRLRERHGLRSVVVGLPDETAALKRTLAASGTPQATPNPPVTPARLYALLRRCRLYVGNDTGPMHMAAAAGIPVVGLFAYAGHERVLTGPATYRPWGVPHRVLTQVSQCDACARRVPTEPHCMLQISVDAACDAAASLMDEVYGGRV